MNDNMVVNIEHLRNVAKDISNQKKIVMNLYENDIKDILLANSACLEEQGINYEIEKEKLAILFNKFEKSMNDLADVLNMKIIPNYEELKSGIDSLFNKEFLTQLEDILK